MGVSTDTHITFDDAGGERVVRVRGAITEGSDFAPAVQGAPAQVRVDLGGVDRINSYGVREWIRFLKALRGAGVRIRLDAVSAPMVRQMNMIPQARSGAEVLSIDAPYFCPACSEEHTLRLPAGARSAAEKATCPRCGAPMDFDDVQQAYFAFLADDPAA